MTAARRAGRPSVKNDGALKIPRSQRDLVLRIYHEALTTVESAKRGEKIAWLNFADNIRLLAEAALSKRARAKG